MKTRESGMPDERTWSTFFAPRSILTALGLSHRCGDAVEFGCGYGTFTVPAARIISGTVHAIDVESAMIETTRSRAQAAGVTNVRLCLRDFVAEGAGLAGQSVDYAMLFNILHAECPLLLLQEAHRVLVPSGKVGIIHWNHDPSTPRGPSMAIRPRPEQCRAWARQAGFHDLPPGIVDLPPYHYGMVLGKAPTAIGPCSRSESRVPGLDGRDGPVRGPLATH